MQLTDLEQGMFDLLPLTRSVRDPVHGTIALSEDELHVVDHPLFRRLHQIRQNGLLYLVFPSATHTRFEHSLGVVAVASDMVQALIRNSTIAARKASPGVLPLHRLEPGCALDLSSVETDVVRRILRLVRLAALAHDLGHGPFSHTFDAFAPSPRAIASLIESSAQLAAVHDLVEPLRRSPADGVLTSKTGARVKHETMSCVLFSAIWADLEQPQETARDICAILLGREELVGDERNRPFVRMMHDIVASAPADADRMDYLERDSRSVGVTYGLFDRDRVMKSFLADC